MLYIGIEVAAYADDSAELRQQLQLLQQQNASLREELKVQREMIDSLSRKVADIQAGGSAAGHESAAQAAARVEQSAMPNSSGGFRLGDVHISGEGGIGLFETGSEGMFPNAEFRVDEARLFVEAPVWNDVYFYSELDLATRENLGLDVQLGELYLDFEDVSKLWGRNRLLNLRVGRLNIPFGEEYLTRYAIDNPLISHSLSDLWGVDEGVELYGSAGRFTYVMAVQNGGAASGRDFTADKSVVARVSYDPNSWLHLSVSGMRTGDLDVMRDYWSELWFANGWIASIGSTNTTLVRANLVEGDVAVHLPHDHIKAFGGYVQYEDNDLNANNGRDIYYYSIEAVHELTSKLYTGIRFSQIFADKGYRLVGQGDFEDYFYGDLTTRLWRLSLGSGYRFSERLVLKAEYTFERGRQASGEQRNHEDLFATEVAFKF